MRLAQMRKLTIRVVTFAETQKQEKMREENEKTLIQEERGKAETSKIRGKGVIPFTIG